MEKFTKHFSYIVGLIFVLMSFNVFPSDIYMENSYSHGLVCGSCHDANLKSNLLIEDKGEVILSSKDPTFRYGLSSLSNNRNIKQTLITYKRGTRYKRTYYVDTVYKIPWRKSLTRYEMI